MSFTQKEHLDILSRLQLNNIGMKKIKRKMENGDFSVEREAHIQKLKLLAKEAASQEEHYLYPPPPLLIRQ